MPVVSLLSLATTSLVIIEQTLHTRHRPPPGQPHLEVPARLETAAAALHAAPFGGDLEWRHAVNSSASPQDAVAALKLVHDVEHLRTVQSMSQTGGGFDTDTYCAPGSWEAMLDATRAWLTATSLAASADGPAFALSRPAGHHATRDTAMGFGLVNFGAAAAAAHLAAHPTSRVSILDWDVHYGNGVASIFADEPRVRYCSLHEEGGFPGGGMDATDVGPLGNLRHVPLPRGSGGAAYLQALSSTALPFLIGPDAPPPALLLICAGYDMLSGDRLATMQCTPSDFGKSVRCITCDFGFPRERIACGLEGGYDLDAETGMPAAVVETCAALVSR